MAKSQSNSSSPKGKLESDAPTNWFARILALLGLELDPDRERKTLLKELKNTLKRSKGKFFHVNGDLVDVGLAKFFYELYAVVGSAQVLLQNAHGSNALKSIFIEQFLTENQRGLQGQLTDEAIREAAKTMPSDQLTINVRAALTDYTAALEIETQKKIDAQYNLFLAFIDFINFNFYFLLKKFDSMLPERDFNYLPRFEAIEGEYVVEDLKDFLVVSASLNANADWEALFDVLKAYKNLEVVSRANWKKLLSSLVSIRKSGILLQITQYLTKDPYYQVKTAYPNEHIVDPYLTNVKNQVESTLSKIVHEKRNDKLNNLVQSVFGTTGISRTKNYTEKANLGFQKKQIAGYTFVEPLNYLKAFLLDYYKRDIRELVNLLLVKGQWMSNQMAQPMSESFHQLMEVSERLTGFDEALAEDAEKGMKIKLLLTRSDKDNNALISLKQQLKDVNAMAKDLIVESANHLIVIGKHIKMVHDDYVKPKHELILNFKALEGSTDKKLREWIAGTYKQLYGFIQLMQFFVKENPS